MIVDYEKDFISIENNKKQNINDNSFDNNIQQKNDKVKRIRSNSFCNFCCIILEKVKFMKFRNKIFRIFNIKRNNNHVKNFEFYLNNEIDSHMCHDKIFFHNFKSLTSIKTIEIINDELLIVKKIEFIIFDFNIEKRKMQNIVTKIKYVSKFDYNLLSTKIFEFKKCEIIQKQNRMYVIDKNDNVTFMIVTRQRFSTNNLYVLNQ